MTELNKKILVIYHGNCADGFTAAWAAWKKFGDSADYFPGVYQNPPPDYKEKDVYIVDFSYKLDVMREICDNALSVTLLDHHAGAKQTFDSLCENYFTTRFDGIFREDESGAKIAWKYFHPDIPVPDFVEVISDRDLWQFKLPYTRNAMASFFSYPYEFELWDKLVKDFEEEPAKYCDEGAGIERKHHKDIAELTAALKYRCIIAGTEVWVASLPYTLTSDAGHLMCGDEKTFAACYWDTPEGRVFSLRSRDDGMDVQEIAKKFGGGGHKHAAGFRIPWNPDRHGYLNDQMTNIDGYMSYAKSS